MSLISKLQIVENSSVFLDSKDLFFLLPLSLEVYQWTRHIQRRVKNKHALCLLKEPGHTEWNMSVRSLHKFSLPQYYPSIKSWLNGKFWDWLYRNTQWKTWGDCLFWYYFVSLGDITIVCVCVSIYVTIIWSSDTSADACRRSAYTNHRPFSWNFIQRQTGNVGGLDCNCHLHFSYMSYASQRNGTSYRSLYIRFVSTKDSQKIPAIFSWTESSLKVFQQSMQRKCSKGEDQSGYFWELWGNATLMTSHWKLFSRRNYFS